MEINGNMEIIVKNHSIVQDSNRIDVGFEDNTGGSWFMVLGSWFLVLGSWLKNVTYVLKLYLS